MFLSAGLLSATPRVTGLALAGAAFALGVMAGTSLGPLVSERSAAVVAPPLETKASSPSQRSQAAHPAEVLRVLDGDTFEARVHLWPGLDVTTKVRLLGIDTPELKARCPAEREKAEAARAALTAILAEGAVEITQVKLDKFGGRVDADASTRQTPNVSAAMLAKGLARNYAGGRRETWCGSS
jgi:endonuclease YncB( thermonuclease family)